MKKLYTILTLLVLSAAMSFSQVNDNTGPTGKSGTGSFGATILKPLTITDAGDAFLGEFVISNVPYNTDNGDIFESVFLGFNIEGEPGHPFSITIAPELSNSIADIKIRTFIDVLDPIEPSAGNIDITVPTVYNTVLSPDDGTFFFELECYEVTAKSSSGGIPTTFLQTVTVAYITL